MQSRVCNVPNSRGGYDPSELINLLYDAVLEREKWPEFFDTLRRQFDGAALVLTQKGTSVPDFRAFGTDPASIQTLREYYWAINPYPFDRALRLRVGEVIAADGLMDQSKILRSEFYNDWMHPQGVSSDHPYVCFHRSKSDFSSLAVAPHRDAFHNDRGKYIDRLSDILPHLVRAAKMSSFAGPDEDSSKSLLDVFSTATILVSSSRRILAMNAAAEMLLQNSALFSARGELRARGSEGQRQLDSLFEKPPIAGLSSGLLGPARIAGESGSLVVWGVDMTRRRNMTSNAAFWDISVPERSYLVIAAKAEHTLNLEAKTIQSAFGLTATEARVASAIVSGQSVAQYAEEAGVSEYTARKQVAAILRKTGSAGQTELAILLARTLGIIDHQGK